MTIAACGILSNIYQEMAAIITPIMPNILEQNNLQNLHNNSHIEENTNEICEEYVKSSEDNNVKDMKDLKVVNGLKGVKGLNTTDDNIQKALNRIRSREYC